MTARSGRCWIVAAALAASAAQLTQAAAEPAWPALLERYAPAVVSLSVTLQTEMEGTGGSPEQSTSEVTGVVVDPAGLILCWNSNFSAGRMAELFGEFGAAGRMKVQATEIKVRLAGDDRELPAFLAATDSDLDLAFVQLEERPAQPLAAVDFARAAKVAIGDPLAAVSRLTSAFGYAPYFDLVRITGEVRKPRPGWILGDGNATAVGMPYFAADGAPAGVLVTVLSRSKSAATPNPTKLMADLFSLGRGQSEAGPLGLFLIPAERVAPVVEQAKKRAAELLAERAATAPAS